MNLVPDLPFPKNEPEWAYRPGTPEHTALARALADHEVVDIPTVIGGKDYFSNDVVEVRSPHDKARVVARIHRPTEAQHREAIETAVRSAADWAKLPFQSRAAVMLRAAEIVGSDVRTRINAATMLGQSKTIDQSDPDAACELIDFLRFNVFYAQKLFREHPVSTAGAANRIDWRPLEGFVYAVSPFNFTAIGANLSTAPALMGNGVVWKPSEKSALANYIFFRALQKAGLPAGVINFVPADAAAMTRVALASPELAGVHYTGSTAVFRSIWAGVGANMSNYRTFPRLVGETGGKGFVLAHPSADVEVLAIALVRAAFEFQGQKCSAASRAYVPKSLWPALSRRIRERLAELPVGDVADPRTFMGAVIDKASFDRLSARLGAAQSDAEITVIAGGTASDEVGWFVQPTVLETSNPRHALMHDELFGPVLTVYPYDDASWPEMFALIDETSPYALTGSVFSPDPIALNQASQALVNAAGNIYLNDKPTGALIGQQPFGGMRGSGTNDKAGSWMNMLRWTSPRTVKETYVPPGTWTFGA
ncbi:L-glutamate gamma-semialdehyde dehydrogenase [Aestuariivirga litoralis]|uniref:L-glutamate gamma-semialdehyde dehydrogenase n=1 Tax=Aestuariivirga litoralis TaxID=2650924 RepID=UPI0019574251|nr:L-glutamate gamma-semialdehyde dehydrogenase [Aestuariivirga litoralis]